ncbi:MULTISPECIES: hypothetical protein [unclassified Okeania]|nr:MULTISPECIES: hypothetical protein [unclassified Okeania]
MQGGVRSQPTPRPSPSQEGNSGVRREKEEESFWSRKRNGVLSRY